MSERDAPPAALLAEELKLNCIKYTPVARPCKLATDHYGTLCVYSWSAQRGGTATITRALPGAQRLQNFLSGDLLEFETNDSIKGTNLRGYAEKLPRKCAVGTAGGRSGAHSRQDLLIQSPHCYAVVVSSWRGENIEIHPSQQRQQLSTNQEGKADTLPLES